MSGDATFAGTTYQAKIAAYIGVYILSQSRLRWLESEDDTPAGYSAETTGPGDDVQVWRTDKQRSVFEVQAKHGLRGGTKLLETIRTIATGIRSAVGPSPRVVVAVDPTSSGTVRTDVATDLARLRSGRADALKKETVKLLASETGLDIILPQISIVTVDVDRNDGSQTREALLRLEAILEDATLAETAFRLLVEDAANACARREARSRKDLVALLKLHRIEVKPTRSEQHRQLEMCRELLTDRFVSAARQRLRSLQIKLDLTGQVDRELQYTLCVLSAKCELLDDNIDASLDYARRALDFNSQGLDAMRIVTVVFLRHRKYQEASDIIERSLKIAPLDEKVWALRLELETATGVAPTRPPHQVSDAITYRVSEAIIARNVSDLAAVLRLTESLVVDSARSIDVLLLRAEALLCAASRSDAMIADAERFCSEALEKLPNEHDPRARQALFLRSAARLESGNLEAAEEDNRKLRSWDEGQVEVLWNAAHIRIRAGDASGAIHVLHDRIVETDLRLLALRSILEAELNLREDAQRDAREALNKLQTDTPADVRILVAQSLADIGMSEEARRVLADPSLTAIDSIQRHLLEGALALESGMVDNAIKSYSTAAQVDLRQRRPILFELASKLGRAKRNAEASDLLLEFRDETLSLGELRLMLQVFLGADRLGDVTHLLEKNLGGSPMPKWALYAAFEVARRREDFDAAIRHLRAIGSHEPLTREAQLLLGELLFEEGRFEEALTEIGALVREEDLSPATRMRAAMMLVQLGRGADALTQAYRAYRTSPGNRSICESFLWVSQQDNTPRTDASEVGVETFVRLKNGDRVREYSILSGSVADATRNEISLNDASVMGLIGKRVGDAVTMSSMMGTEAWVVDELLPAYRRAIRELYLTFEERFPNQTALFSFPAPTGTSVGDVSPLIQSVGRERQREQAVLKNAHDSGLPLGFVAQMLKCSIPVAMSKLSQSGLPGVAVEWPDPGLQKQSSETARSKRTIVLTRSALESLMELDAFYLLQSFDLMAPRSLRKSLEREVRDAAQLVARGRMSMSAGDTGLVVQKLDPEDPAAVDHHGRLIRLLEWVKMNVRLLPRPLEALGSDEQRENLREMIGAESSDALELARAENVPFYADDLGLRRLGINGTLSFSTPALVVAMESLGAITAQAAMRLLRISVLAGRHFVAVSAGFLFAALREGGELSHDDVVRVFQNLRDVPTVLDAARITAECLKMVALADIEPKSIVDIIGLAAGAMCERWSVPLVVQELRRAAEAEFRLLPNKFLDVERALADFLRRR